MTYIDHTAIIDPGAELGHDCTVWAHSHIRSGARIGEGCIIGEKVYVDANVTVGRNCKLQNGVLLYHGVTLDDGVFMGPGATTTNDRFPRAINPDGSLESSDDWVIGETHIGKGAAIGARAVIRCGVTIGPWAMIGAGAVVVRDVPAHGLVVGVPGELIGFVCHRGHQLVTGAVSDDSVTMSCRRCQPPSPVVIPRDVYGRLR